jgi:hypothetical protein
MRRFVTWAGEHRAVCSLMFAAICGLQAVLGFLANPSGLRAAVVGARVFGGLIIGFLFSASHG